MIGFGFLLIRSKPDRVAVRKKDNPLPVGAKIKAKKTCPIANFLPDLARGRALVGLLAASRIKLSTLHLAHVL